MGIYTGLLDPEVCPGGKSSHFFSHERSLGIAETIPLNSSKIETWIKSTLNNGKAKSTLERNANFKSFIDNTALQILTCKG
ncbi:hypothetical protein [Cylindrospermopsis raciborskii]|uniref:hypothetical protein n=1 Tax=Cylindrospermopsis raciborskii TaxID=77022 RepID=UPI0011439EA9|nr:hypothetical protein [Cylindrospermopsis raciborskii]TPX27640.1 hypothetical protein FIV49_15900 [Cylindrospermopsis raciborskii GIHE 2018]